jgi:putative alpha-1,2-mannosidase
VVNPSKKNIYVRKTLLNGRLIQEPFIDHFDLINGGELEFHMSDQRL